MSLVTTEWLNEKICSEEWMEKFCLLDATWDLPKSKRNFVEEYKNCRIPGAKYFSLAECRNKEAKLPNTMPSVTHFEDYVTGLGISNDHHIIIYDNSERFGLFSAPRAWWLFNLFGHSKVSILDGGLPKWKRDGYKTVSGDTDEENEPSGQKFVAKFNPDIVVDLAFMKSNVEKGGEVQVIDARPNGRFRGVEPEPRPDIPSGHIPHSTSIPFFTNFDMEKKVLLPLDDIRANFLKQKIDIEKSTISSCGSGMSACILVFLVYLMTDKIIPLFDDSWFGWQTNTPDELQIREKPQQ